MQSMNLDLFSDLTPQSSFGKTSPESCQPKTMPSDVSSHSYVGVMNHFLRPTGGQMRVAFLGHVEQQHGASWMPNTLEWPNDAAVCSLSQVLETGLIPQRFFLSSTACAGILRRAEKRGKSPPPALEQALQSVALVAR